MLSKSLQPGFSSTAVSYHASSQKLPPTNYLKGSYYGGRRRRDKEKPQTGRFEVGLNDWTSLFFFFFVNISHSSPTAELAPLQDSHSIALVEHGCLLPCGGSALPHLLLQFKSSVFIPDSALPVT